MQIRRLFRLDLGRSMLIASACALGLSSVAQAQAQRSTSATVRPLHAEYGTVVMVHTASTTCLPGESGMRRQVFTVDFARPFQSNAYAVTLGIRGLDAGPWVRIASHVQARTPTNMTIVAETWCTTTIMSADIDYMAVGE